MMYMMQSSFGSTSPSEPSAGPVSGGDASDLMSQISTRGSRADDPSSHTKGALDRIVLAGTHELADRGAWVRGQLLLSNGGFATPAV